VIADVASLRVGRLAIDPWARRVTLDGQRVTLTSREYALLYTLAEAPDRVFTREELYQAVWGGSQFRSRTLDSHIWRLRRKLSECGGEGLIENVWGVGYRLVARVPEVRCPHCGGRLDDEETA
jgi:two-component system response regulator ResD